MTLRAIGLREGVSGGYVVRLIRLAFLDPRILEAVIDGNAPSQMTSERLTMPQAVRARWGDQRQDFGFPPLP